MMSTPDEHVEKFTFKILIDKATALQQFDYRTMMSTPDEHVEKFTFKILIDKATAHTF